MSGDYHTHTDRKYDEILERLDALERKVSNSKLLMKRTDDGHYEKLVDVVLEHDKTITEIVEYTVGGLTEVDDTNW
jgi:lysyl-tRNA synthetase class I